MCILKDGHYSLIILHLQNRCGEFYKSSGANLPDSSRFLKALQILYTIALTISHMHVKICEMEA